MFGYAPSNSVIIDKESYITSKNYGYLVSGLGLMISNSTDLSTLKHPKNDIQQYRSVRAQTPKETDLS